MDKGQLSLRFKNFAENECRGSSKLYEFLSLSISDDDQILELCAEAQDGQPVPNLLFGAVHYLLLNGKEHILKEYYPSITRNPRKIKEAFFHFKSFCEIYKNEIVVILKNKLVQTNEVRRCAYLYPIFCYIYGRVEKPLSLVEIGTSAGLQLLWDKYSYSYGTNETYGDTYSNVHITSEIRGDKIPLFLQQNPPIASKIGLDIHTNDLRNSEDYLWLKGLIWPEHQERLDLFESAVKMMRENPVELVEGDGVALLTNVVKKLPKGTAICIFHTHVANQMPEESRYELVEKIKEIGSTNDVFHIYNNMWDRNLHLDYYIKGVEHRGIIGETDGHGRWFEWNLD
ncbi:DUF2332 domain-containing protein [Virgibacillus sp. DJP39]|uniref:DUF2332 domain-containing protein n=1 Tax=Virgibacillus sp. DJP39 TaxID=3409790 RepID=UPI003BB64821